MNTSDLEQDVEAVMDICSLEKSDLQEPAAEVKIEADSRAEGENNDEASKAEFSGKARRRKKRHRNEPLSIIGSGEGPSGVNVLDFVEARATEVQSMRKALRGKEMGKRAFQTLPRHMRRRAMSHNPKRLPRRLREQAAREMETGEEGSKKPPCRRKRRKASAMKRQQGSSGGGAGENETPEVLHLETHHWHAKRMHMVEKYKCRVAMRCCDKGVRAAHRSMVHGCLLSDISYYHCYEVVGTQSAVIESLKPLFHMETGLTIRAKAYLKGQRAGRAILYKSGAYPTGAIAPVEFLWQAPPPIPSESGKRDTKLWIWCHPAAEKHVMFELKHAVRSYCSSSGEMVGVSQQNLVRFRLVGPRSHALLMETLKPVWSSENFQHEMESNPLCNESTSGYDEGFNSDGGNLETEEVEGESLPPVEKWWEFEHLSSQLAAHSNALSTEYPAIKGAADPSQFGRGTVIGMTVQDPRLFTPSKKTDMVSAHYPKKHNPLLEEEEEEDREAEGSSAPSTNLFSILSAMSGLGPALPASLSSDIAFSPIWDFSVRKSVSNSKIPDEKLNQLRAKKFIKSSVLGLGDSAPRIPVLLIQQTPQAAGNGSQSFPGAGWDLVLPPKWAMAFWVSLIYRGARACGMTELSRCDLASSVLHFPEDFPDTKAGQKHIASQRSELEAEYLRKPPDKRINYGKLLVPTPFHVAWERLVRSWVRKFHDGEEACGIILGRKRARGREEEGNCFQVVPCKRPRMGETVDNSNNNVTCDVVDTVWGNMFLDPGVGFSLRREDVSERSSSPRPGKSVGFYVLRSRQDLNSLKQFVSSLCDPAKTTRRGSGKMSTSSGNEFGAAIRSFDIDSLLENHCGSLIAVKVEVLRAGTLSVLDSISLPTSNDLKSELTSAQSSSLPVGGAMAVRAMLSPAQQQQRQWVGPTEVVNRCGLTVVVGQSVVVGLSNLSHTKMVKKKKCKKGSSGECPDVLVENFRLFPVRPSRETIGHVTSSNYNLSTSLHSGVGFVTLPGLVEAVRGCHGAGLPQLLALARGATEQYTFVKVNIL